jgi:PTS system mannose-specific IID component
MGRGGTSDSGTFKTLMRCFARTYLVGANFNPHGLQNMGLMYAMDPGLRMLYPDAKDLTAARERYLGTYNTHPYWTPLLVGYFLFLEAKIAQRLLPAESFQEVKKTATYTFSALGDSFFGGSLLVAWSLISVILLVQGWIWMAVAWLILSFIGLQGIKISTFWLGWTRGLTFLEQLKRLDLIGWGQRIKLFNALLLVLFWFLVSPFKPNWLIFGASTCVLAGLTWVVSRRFVSREVLILCLLGIWLIWSFL